MIIEKLSSLTIKVSLSYEELKIYSLDFDSMTEHNENTKNLLKNILKEIYNHLGLNLFNETLYIKAFSGSGQKCILYISVSLDSDEYDYSDSSVTEKTIVESGNCRDIILFSKDLVRYYNDYCKNSSLYHYNNIFRILIESEQAKSKSIADCADSHRLRSMYGNIIEAQTTEYFDCVIDNRAVEKLSGENLL